MKSYNISHSSLENLRTEMGNLSESAEALSNGLKQMLAKLSSSPFSEPSLNDTDHSSDQTTFSDIVPQHAPVKIVLTQEEAERIFGVQFATICGAPDDDSLSTEVELAKVEPTPAPEEAKSPSPQAKSAKPKQTPEPASEFFRIGRTNIEITKNWVAVTKNGAARLPVPLANVIAEKRFKFSKSRGSWVSRTRHGGIQGKALREELRAAKSQVA